MTGDASVQFDERAVIYNTEREVGHMITRHPRGRVNNITRLNVDDGMTGSLAGKGWVSLPLDRWVNAC